MNFYVLDQFPRGDADTVMYFVGNHVYGHAPRCRSCGKAVGGLISMPPYEVELEVFERDFGDVVFGPGDEFLVSRRFKDHYDEEGLSGLSGFESVEIIAIKSRRRDLPPAPQYFRVLAHRGGATIDTQASGFEWLSTPTCPLCQSALIVRWKRLILEHNSWTGEDVSYAHRLSGTIFVSERFKTFCEKNQIANALFHPAETYACDFYPGLKDPSELEQFKKG